MTDSVSPFRLPALGSIVQSTKGSDKGTLYLVLVVSLAKPYRVMLIDGKRHGVDHPKSKNPMHCETISPPQIKQTQLVIQAQAAQTTEAIRQANASLRKYLKKEIIHVEGRCH